MYATYIVTHTIHTKTQRLPTSGRKKKEGVYAISMGIIHGNNFEHSLRVCHFVASNNLGLTAIWVCGIGESGLSDHLHFYCNLDPAFLRVAAHFQLDCFKALNIGTRYELGSQTVCVTGSGYQNSSRSTLSTASSNSSSRPSTLASNCLTRSRTPRVSGCGAIMKEQQSG